MGFKFNPLNGTFDLVDGGSFDPTDLQDQIDDLGDRLDTVEDDLPNKINSTEKGAANGVATLDAEGKIPSTQLPSYVDDVLEYPDLLSFPIEGEASKIYVALDTNLTYRWSGSAYIQISESPVLSVNTKVGAVVLTKSDIGLGNVDNTSDLDKPISTATQNALNLKQDSLGFTPENVINKSTDTNLGTSNTLYPSQNAVKTYVDNSIDSLTKSDVGLGNVDNTSDLDKPISSATQTALDGKVAKAGDTLTGGLTWNYDLPNPGVTDSGSVLVQGTGISATYSYTEFDGIAPDPDFTQSGTSVIDGFGVNNVSYEQGERRDSVVGYSGFFHSKVEGTVRTPIMPVDDYQLVPKAYVDQEVSTVSGVTTEIFTDTKEPTGFVNRDESVLDFNPATRQFTIGPMGVSFSFYLKGVKYTKETTESVFIPNSDGNHYIYFDANGELTSTQVFSLDIIEQFAFVSIIYWNTSTNSHVYFAEERHGITMDGVSHAYLHTVFGSRYLSGLALQAFSVDGDGSSDTHAQFTADSGSFRDEDILLVSALQEQIPILYRIGDHWRKKPADDYPLIYNDGITYTGARIPFNEFTGGAWQLTPVDNNKFVLVHFFASNDIQNPIVGIQGIAQYNDIPAARIAANTEITTLSGLPFAEFVPIGTVVFQTGTFSNTVNAIVRSVDGANYVDFRGTQLYTPAGEATEHSLLSGLADDDHIQYHTDARGDARYNLKSQGDISETSFSLANNQTTFSNVTGLSFGNTVVRGFSALVTVEIDATSDLFEQFTLNGIQKSSGWNMAVESVGDNSGIVFSITSTGQVQYTSQILSGFVSGLIKFKAITTSF